ncbi:hypothetical protein ACP70R_042473 [Stipagrostis hirtigluma subsp. patula]
MASPTALTVLFGFSAVFWCLNLLEPALNIQTSWSRTARLAAGALVPAVLATFALTLLLLFAHVRALGLANAAAGAGGGFRLGRLGKATLAAATATLLAGAALRRVADDVEWVYAK